MMAILTIKKSDFPGFSNELQKDEFTICRHCANLALLEET